MAKIAPHIRVTMLLCDHAVVSEGKLFISGGGWSITGPMPAPSAIAIKIDLPWDWANKKIIAKLTLQGADGEQIVQPQVDGSQVPVEIGAELEVGRPPGLKPGTTLDVPLAFTVGPLLLAPGQRYTWVFTMDDQTHEDWHLSFETRPMPQGPAGPFGPSSLP